MRQEGDYHWLSGSKLRQASAAISVILTLLMGWHFWSVSEIRLRHPKQFAEYLFPCMAVCHIVLASLMIIGRQTMFVLMIGVSALDIVLGTYYHYKPLGLAFPLVNIFFLTLCLGKVRKSPGKPGGFDVIMKEEEK